jgi:hypothetical protein
MDIMGKSDPFVRVYMMPSSHEVDNCPRDFTVPLSGAEDQGRQENPQPSLELKLYVRGWSTVMQIDTVVSVPP